jgi:hypothetical protein
VGSDATFVFDAGKRADALSAVLPDRAAAVARRAPDYRDAEFWRSGHALGIGHIRVASAVEWLLRYAYTGRRGDVSEEARVLAAQVEVVGDLAGARVSVETGYIVVPEFHLASAIVAWANTGVLPSEPVARAQSIAQDHRAAQGGLAEAIATVPRSGGWERALAREFAPEFVASVLLEDWAWVDEAHNSGFAYLDALKKPSAPGLIGYFCILLRRAEATRTHDDIAACREALNRCAQSWADSLIADEPWDARLSWLFLCAYAFDRTVAGVQSSLPAVNRALLGRGH